MLSRICVATLFALFCAQAARAQATSQLTGIVADANGGVIPGATVTIKNVQLGATLSVETDRAGRYEALLAPGVYEVRISEPGFKTAVFYIRVLRGRTATRNVTLEVGSVSETVTVGAGVPPPPPPPPPAKAMRAPGVVGGVPGGVGGGVYQSSIGYPPGRFNTEDYGLIKESAFRSVEKNPLSTFSIDVDTASYSNMRRFLREGRLPPVDAIRIEELINYFRYDYPEPDGEHPFSITTEIAECPWKSEHQLLHVGLKARSVPMEDLPANNIVFLLDVSGSMQPPNKLPLLQRAFSLLANELRPQDRVAIVVYAGAAGLILPSTPGSEKQRILAAISQLQAGGSTAGGAGIQLAYKVAKENFLPDGNNRVILATDGDFNVGASSDGEMVRLIETEREAGISLTVLGFGMGNLKDSKMEQLADHGNGNYAYIDSLIEARKVLVEQLGGTLLTLAKDVKIQIEFNPAHVQTYRLIGYENRLLREEDFRDDTKDAGELGAGHTVTALYELVPAGTDSHVAQVDKLKYQEVRPIADGAADREALTVKLRYKELKGAASKLVERPVLAGDLELANASRSFRFAAAVAGFGMLLRDSKHKGGCNWDTIASLADGAKGSDRDGRRSELVYLLRTAQRLQGN